MSVAKLSMLSSEFQWKNKLLALGYTQVGIEVQSKHVYVYVGTDDQFHDSKPDVMLAITLARCKQIVKNAGIEHLKDDVGFVMAVGKFNELHVTLRSEKADSGAIIHFGLMPNKHLKATMSKTAPLKITQINEYGLEILKVKPDK